MRDRKVVRNKIASPAHFVQVACKFEPRCFTPVTQVLGGYSLFAWRWLGRALPHSPCGRERQGTL